MEKEFWDERYLNQEIGWNMGEISTPLKEYADQLKSKDLAILIPGCGYGHEAAYLHEQGFTNVTVLDFSAFAIDEFKSKNPNFPQEKYIQGDFFTHKGNYDLILEQTFFCAIKPEMRPAYVSQVFDLLSENGKLVGLLFDCNFENSPPFPGSKEEYLELFGAKFMSISIEKCYNSIAPRAGREVFIKIKK